MPITNVPTPDYIPEPLGDRKKWDAGEYTAIGIQWFSLSKDSNQPIFVNQNGRMVARCYLLLKKSPDEGPPFSVDSDKVPLLVRALGGDPAKLPNMQADYSAYLLAAQNLTRGKEVKIKVGDEGWVGDIHGMVVPEGYFRVSFVKINTRDESDRPAVLAGEWGQWFAPQLKVVADVTGNATPYDGITTNDPCSYGLVNKNSNIEFEISEKTGQWTANAVRTNRLIQAFAPETVNAVFGDLDNILPEFEQEAQRAKRVAIAQRKASQKTGKVRWDYGSLQFVEVARELQSVLTKTISQGADTSPVLPVLFRLLKAEANRGRKEEEGELVVTEDGLSFSDAGKKWAKEYGLKDKIASLKPHTNFFSKMTDNELIAICELIGGEAWKATAEAAVGVDEGDL